MFLGIEIGGTKLQFGVGSGTDSRLVAIQRADVQPELGASGIRRDVERLGKSLVGQYGVRGVGIGFGGPVDTDAGRTITSHQVEGWDNFPLADWCRRTLGLPTVLSNDSDAAGLAEARFGAGRGHRVVFYTNIGSGIGGALVIDGHLFRGGRGVASELGHLRPGLDADSPDRTVESIASGWGITEAVRRRLAEPTDEDQQDIADLNRRYEGQIEQLSTKIIAEAAEAGNRLAQRAFDRACQAYGWGIAQMITLIAPDAVVIGGGVSLVADELLMLPLGDHVNRYVFPPLEGTFQILRAELGETMVVHGVLAMAAAGSGE